MRFGRKAAETPRIAAASALPATTAVQGDDANIPLIDVEGHGFERLRSIDIGHGLWRPNALADLDRLHRHQIVVVAAYSPEDIEACRPLMQRFMTIVLAVGIGPRYGSRALALGAIAYLDSDTDDNDIKGRFGDAVARVQIRRLREAAA
jgi:hypothetical protein